VDDPRAAYGRKEYDFVRGEVNGGEVSPRAIDLGGEDLRALRCSENNFAAPVRTQRTSDTFSCSQVGRERGP
jgi:hypothetical protein